MVICFPIQTTHSSSTSDQVTVSASVQPYLSLTIDSGEIAFGYTKPEKINETASDPVVTVRTNATMGVTVYIEDNNPLGMYNQSHGNVIAPTPNNEMIAGQEGFDIEVSEITDPQNNGIIRTEFAPGGDGVLSLQPQIIASTTGPTGGLQISTNVRFAYSTQTPAGYYKSFFVYTATGRF